MENIFFILKTLVLTIGLVMVMQIKTSETTTVETVAVQWLQSNAAVDALRGVADGAVKGIKQFYRGTMAMIDRSVGQSLGPHEEQAGNRKEFFKLKRSEAVQKAEEAKQAEQLHQDAVE